MVTSIGARQTEQQLLLKAQQQKLERLRYQAKFAESQFNQVDPNNRLVAAELEKRWEQALRELKQAEKIPEEKLQAKNTIVISEEIKLAFSNIGKELPKLWNKPDLSRKQHKDFLRCLIDKVVVHRKERDTLSIRIIWKGGDTTITAINIPVGSFNQLSCAKELEQKIITLSEKGENDASIAQQLTAHGYRSPLKVHVLPNTV